VTKTWRYTEAQVVEEKHGRLVDTDGHLVSSYKAGRTTVRKAMNFLSALFELFDSHGASIYEDEQGVIAVDLGNGFEVVYHNAERDAAQILRGGFLVGYLTKGKRDNM